LAPRNTWVTPGSPSPPKQRAFLIAIASPKVDPESSGRRSAMSCRRRNMKQDRCRCRWPPRPQSGPVADRAARSRFCSARRHCECQLRATDRVDPAVAAKGVGHLGIHRPAA
jgi:hypothetical protein